MKDDAWLASKGPHTRSVALRKRTAQTGLRSAVCACVGLICVTARAQRGDCAVLGLRKPGLSVCGEASCTAQTGLRSAVCACVGVVCVTARGLQIQSLPENPRAVLGLCKPGLSMCGEA